MTEEVNKIKKGLRRAHDKRSKTSNPVPGMNPALKDAEVVLAFAASPEWPMYQEYLETKFGLAMLDAVKAKKGGNDREMAIALTRAEVFSELLEDVNRYYQVAKLDNLQKERQGVPI